MNGGAHKVLQARGSKYNSNKVERKKPLIEWKEFQKRKITEEEINTWFCSGIGLNLGIVCGGISQNLVVVDFDEKKLCEKVFGDGISKETYVVKTNRGKHVYFKTDYPIKSFKISELGIDIKAEGGYVLAPPSTHPAGTEYVEERITPIKHFQGDFKEEFLRTLEEKIKTFDCKKHTQIVDVQELLKGVEKGKRNDSAIRIATWHRLKGLKKEETIEKMLEWNTLNNPSLTEEEVKIVVESAYTPSEPYGYLFSKTEQKTVFSPEITEKAMNVLEKYDVFQHIQNSVSILHAGDESIILIEWISALSSSIEETKINTWIIGKSQKGKSHSKQTVLRLLPREYYEVFTSASPVSLFYYIKENGEWALDKKLLYLDEVEASSSALPMLRSLTGQTDIQPRHLSVHEAKILDLCIKGKRTVWFTSVQTFGSDQIKNRFIHLNPDESEDQDEKVFLLQDKKYRLEKTISDKLIQVAQAISKIVVEETQNLKVIIPFEIDWPFKNRRWLYPIFLSFIKVITKIRFKKRKRDSTGAIIAESEDFELAKKLWKRFIKTIIFRVSTSALTIYEILPDSPDDALTHSEISKNINLSTKQIERLCKEMVDEGLINNRKRTNEGKTGRSSWEYWRADLPSINEMKIKPNYGHSDIEREEKKENDPSEKKLIDNVQMSKITDINEVISS